MRTVKRRIAPSAVRRIPVRNTTLERECGCSPGAHGDTALPRIRGLVVTTGHGRFGLTREPPRLIARCRLILAVLGSGKFEQLGEAGSEGGLQIRIQAVQVRWQAVDNRLDN